MFAAGSYQGSVCLYDVGEDSDEAMISVMAAHPAGVTTVEFSSDGLLLFTGALGPDARLPRTPCPSHPCTVSGAKERRGQVLGRAQAGAAAVHGQAPLLEQPGASRVGARPPPADCGARPSTLAFVMLKATTWSRAGKRASSSCGTWPTVRPPRWWGAWRCTVRSLPHLDPAAPASPPLTVR